MLTDEVVIAAGLGEPWALRVVYDSLAPSVLAYARRYGSPDAEDLTSEVFLAVFSQMSRLDGTVEDLRRWVFKVAHNKAVDDLRKRTRRGTPLEYVPEQDVRLSPSAEDEAAASLGSERARDLVLSLVPDQRDVMMLRVFGDLTVEQVAEVLGKSPGAVKQLQRRALASLRRSVAEGVPL